MVNVAEEPSELLAELTGKLPTTTTTKKIYLCLSLIRYIAYFQKYYNVREKHGYHQQRKCCPSVIPNQSNKIKKK